MNELTVKIVMILFPGIICTILLDKILEHKPWDNFKYSLLIIFYGILSYSFLQLSYTILELFKAGYCNFNLENVKVLSVWDFGGNGEKIPYIEVIFAGLVSIVLACLISYIEHKEFLISIFRKFSITEKYGDYTTTYQLLKNNRNEWIDITIWDKNLFIRGVVVSINETNGLCELCIYKAEVFQLRAEEIESLYFVEYISISEKYENLIISTTQQPKEIKNG